MLKNSQVQELLMDITDDEKNSITIIECLLNGKTSDESIAEETEIKLNIVRKILNKLYDAGVASYKRSKDPETNFEIYNWKFDQKKVNDIISDKHEDLLKEIERSLKYEKDNMFFACKANGHRYIYENASEYNFICPKCGESLEYQDNTLIIGELLNKKAKYESMSKIKTEYLSYIN
ncbi:transcription factor E [Methanobacterium spitsbergense]|uniref:Transcription factor E n=1 Tax=Methanobacterium spitsbergense TaxID=2874285 RepID=A0A8T5UR33_9EURY|nr:transcription factor E [Methanobacterium spitsbergense]MBZ2164597.1 transcription factor E [Methanobacterium spitsbergense]